MFDHEPRQYRTEDHWDRDSKHSQIIEDVSMRFLLDLLYKLLLFSRVEKGQGESSHDDHDQHLAHPSDLDVFPDNGVIEETTDPPYQKKESIVLACHTR